jgi:hypothetical protein
LFHIYTNDEIKRSQRQVVDISEGVGGTNDYIILHNTWGYGGGCGSTYTGVISFNNLLCALEYFLEVIERDNRNDNLAENIKSIQEAIAKINHKKSDENLDVFDCVYDLGNTGLSIYCAGYWDDVVICILEGIIFDLEDNVDAQGGVILMSTRELLNNENIHEQSFVESFTSICCDYNTYKNG